MVLSFCSQFFVLSNNFPLLAANVLVKALPSMDIPASGVP